MIKKVCNHPPLPLQCSQQPCGDGSSGLQKQGPGRTPPLLEGHEVPNLTNQHHSKLLAIIAARQEFQMVHNFDHSLRLSSANQNYSGPFCGGELSQNLSSRLLRTASSNLSGQNQLWAKELPSDTLGESASRQGQQVELLVPKKSIRKVAEFLTFFLAM